jgi:hypothetical protein
MQSPIYWHPLLYSAAMKLSYGKKFEERYKALDKHIPAGCNLLELCMGDAYFYLKYLAKKKVNYSCADINPVFVNAAKQKGLRSTLLDASFDEIQPSDFILMQASLYHFIPNQKEVIKKMIAAAGKQIIFSESVDNLSNSSSGLKSYLGEQLSKAKSGQSRIKFTGETLKETFAPFGNRISVWEETPDNREIIIVLNAL